MLFNISKFRWLQLGKNSDLKNDYCYMSEHRDFPIVPSDEVRDLGIIMSQFGDYNAHIDYICKK